MEDIIKRIFRKIKILILLISVIMSGFMMISINANSAAVNLSTDKTVVKRGDKVKIIARAVDVSNINGGFNGYSGSFSYDVSTLSNLSNKDTMSVISGWSVAYNTANNSFVGSDPTGMDFKVKDIDFIVLDFIVLENAPLGKTLINLSDIKLSDSNYKTIKLADTSIELTIEEKSETKPPEKSSNNKLSNLKPSTGSLSPKFDSDIKNYTISVDNTIDSISFETLLSDSKATIISGNKSHNLSEGKNTINFLIKAEDGSENTYTIVVDRAKKEEVKPDDKDDDKDNDTKPNNNNNSSSDKDNTQSSNNIVLDVSGLGYLKDMFNPQVNNYISYVGKEVEKLSPKITLEDKNAKYELVGIDNLKIGENIIKLIVTAENGDIREYIFNVIRSEEENTSTLSYLTIGGYAINPGFRPDINYYSLIVDSETSSLGVSAAASSAGAIVSISGNDKLNYGVNLIKVSVDSNYFQNTYLIEVIREANTNNSNILPWVLVGISFMLVIILLVVMYFKNKILNENHKNSYDPLLVYLMNQNNKNIKGDL